MSITNITDRDKNLLCIGTLFLLSLLFFWRIVFLVEYPMVGILLISFIPWKYYLIHQIRMDRLPLWNPYTFGGNPLLLIIRWGYGSPGYSLLFYSNWGCFSGGGCSALLFSGSFHVYPVRHLGLTRAGSLLSG